MYRIFRTVDRGLSVEKSRHYEGIRQTSGNGSHRIPRL